MCKQAKSKSLLQAVMILLFLLPTQVFAQFSFAVVSDQRRYAGSGTYNSADYFSGAVKALQSQGAGAFMVSPGDIDPPQDSYWTIQSILGSGYQWYPVAGNHELPGKGFETIVGANIQWLRNHNYDINGVGLSPDIVNQGPTGCPETTFSFDHENGHFVVLNEYCDTSGDSATDGDIPDHLYTWLVNDLAATSKQHIFVFGHEPAFPQPDADNGRLRHSTDSLNAHPSNRDRFWSLLKQHRVVAYFCGHTHNYSVVKIDGVWQVDSGHARGKGDTGAPSTFLKVHVNGGRITFNAYRDVHDGSYDYNDILHRGTLKGFPWQLLLPNINNKVRAKNR